MVKVSVPGKIILAGEHAVVYGYPAVVASINRRLRVEARLLEEDKVVIKDKYDDLGLSKFVVNECLKEVEGKYKGVEIMIESELPTTGGLGSSAALATGVVWAMLKDKNEEVKNQIVKKSEDFQHGKSSGVDQVIVREGGAMKYEKGKFDKFEVTNLEFILIDSGRPEESTGEMVKQVAKGSYKKEFMRMGEIAKNWEVDLIEENQRLLEKIGVVGERAKKIVKEIKKIGGVAKVCGAGGVKSGSGIILAYHQDSEGLIRLATTKGYPYYQVKLGDEGVSYE